MRSGSGKAARVAVDIGGTFTDVALEVGERLVTRKVLTTHAAPERAVIEAVGAVVAEAGLTPADVALVIHGTTLATNAIIERKGAKTALITTEGFRDSVEMAYENRFEQYDIGIEKPPPLVPRHLRWPVRERVGAQGQILLPLDEGTVEALIPEIAGNDVASIAIGLIHGYANGDHEQRVAEIVARALPDVSLTLSSEVCPEIREYERLSTACANAYVRPLMARYLGNLDRALDERGFACPILLMTSGGGLTTLETAARFPIRLVESGPAGGAILAAGVARECGIDALLSFDMGGTTAKICLIDDGAPQTSRSFEVARMYRFTKGSGLPLRIPVIEMVEIGAGGGSLAGVDSLGRVAVGPESAGSEPGPACYGRGGERPAVTDADLVLGRIAPDDFAGGTMPLDGGAAATALTRHVGRPLGLDESLAAFAVSEMVDENMANAARVHAIERGKDVVGRTLLAFGGAAPLHAARVAEKLGIERVIVPTGAGVGSAIGFLRAPVAYEVVRSRYMRLGAFDAAQANALFAEMAAEALAVVRQAAPDADFVVQRTAFMRYVGQGHEIAVALPGRDLVADDRRVIQAAFDDAYAAHYGRTIPDAEGEILSWMLSSATPAAAAPPAGVEPAEAPASPVREQQVFDLAARAFAAVPVYRRENLRQGARFAGPALVVESQTTTVVPAGFDGRIDTRGYIVLERRKETPSHAA